MALTSIFRSSSLGILLHTAVLAVLLGVPAVGNAQIVRMEIHSFQTTTLTDQEFLIGRKEGVPATISGELRFPKQGTDRVPVIVLLHGSGGVSGYVTDWEQDFNAMGVATFVIDSFTGRGIANTNNDQAQLGRLAMIVDAYRALNLLAKHPRIDPDRIVLMGFSRGGVAALYASVKRFQRMHGTTGQEFAAYIPFYPTCNTYREEDEVADKPIRLFHGSSDNYAAIGPCRTYVERLNAKGKNAQLTEYPGAGHVFDWQALKTPIKLEKAQTTRQCQLTEAENGVIINAKTKQPFTYADPCVEYGPTIAYDEKASMEARKAIRELVATTLKPQ